MLARTAKKRGQQLLARAIVCATDGGASCVCVHTLNYHEYFVVSEWVGVAGGCCAVRRRRPRRRSCDVACKNSYQEVVVGIIICRTRGDGPSLSPTPWRVASVYQCISDEQVAPAPASKNRERRLLLEWLIDGSPDYDMISSSSQI
jgi:hypothetical protein